MAKLDHIEVKGTTYDIAPSNDATIEATSGDSSTASSWTAVNPITSGETVSNIFTKITTMVKNIRYLFNVIGTTDISSLGNTITAAVATLNTNKAAASHSHTVSDIPAQTAVTDDDTKVPTGGAVVDYVGSHSGGGIIVQASEPGESDRGKLWVDTDDEGGSAIYSEWGNIQGDLNDQADVCDMIGGLGNTIGNRRGWNQLAGRTITNDTGLTCVNTNGIWHVSGTLTTAGSIYCTNASIMSGRKMIIGCTNTGGTIPSDLIITDSYSNVSLDTLPTQNESSYKVYTASSVNCIFKLDFTNIAVGTAIDFYITPQLHDMTSIFGAGNEPTTAEQFKTMFPANCYSYYKHDADILLEDTTITETGNYTLASNVLLYDYIVVSIIFSDSRGHKNIPNATGIIGYNTFGIDESFTLTSPSGYSYTIQGYVNNSTLYITTFTSTQTFRIIVYGIGRRG